jgi:chitodextrinase
VDIGNLAADMSYVFRVRAVMSEGDTSDWSDAFVCKTSLAESFAAAAKLKKVAVAKGVEKPTISTLTLNLTKNAKLAEAANTASYIVSCTSNPMQKFSYTITGEKIFIEGLQPGTKYTFAVQAIHTNGNGNGLRHAFVETFDGTGADHWLRDRSV